MTAYTKQQLDALLDQRDRLNKELMQLSVQLERKHAELASCIKLLQQQICKHDEGVERVARARMDTLGQFLAPEVQIQCRVCMASLP